MSAAAGPMRNHSPEVDVLADALRATARGRGAAGASRMLTRIRHVETATGQPLTVLLEALERSATQPTRRAAAALAARDAEALTSIGADLTAREPAERPSFITDLAYRRLLNDALTTSQAARLLGVDESRIRQRIAARTLLSARVKGTHRLPRFQFTEDGELPGWSQVAPHVPPTLPLIAVARFLAGPHVDLTIDGTAVTPTEWLIAGGDPAVLAALIGQ